MRFGRLLFFGACSNRIRPGGQQRAAAARIVASVRCASPPYPRLPPSPFRLEKGSLRPSVHFTIHNRAISPVARPPLLFTPLFLTGDADLVALRLLYTQRDISRHVAPALVPMFLS